MFNNSEFKNIIQLVRAFPDEQTCIDHFEKMRWNGNVVSPFDPASKVWKCKGNKYRCKNTGKYFNVRTGTMMDNTKVELQKWFMAIYLITGHKKGISSMQLSRDLDVTQKTAWFMLHRIRACFGISEDNEPMGGGGQAVEVDETYVGGKVKSMNKSKRALHGTGAINSQTNKTPIMGYVVRGGALKLRVIKDRKEIPNNVLDTVAPDAVLITDSAGYYLPISKEFASHEVVDHSKGEFVRETIHTNTIEGVFSLFDRMVIGTYHSLSQKHMQKYANEMAFRYNTRNSSEQSRFNILLANCNQRLKYTVLIAK